MKYVKIEWIHSVSDAPVTIYSELNDKLWDQRKVEVFRDGSIGYADQNEEAGGTILGLEPWPDLDVLGNEPEFQISYITQSEFETRWNTRK